MGAYTHIAQRPEVSVSQRKEDEIAKKIRKLRWIGMHDEALDLERKFLEFASAEIAHSGPIETD